MESPNLGDNYTTLVGSSDFQIKKVSYSDEAVRIDKVTEETAVSRERL